MWSIPISFKRWEWKTNQTTSSIIRRNIRYNKNENGIKYTHKKTIERNGYRPHTITTNTLQSRYWVNKRKNSNRGGWKYTQNQKMEIFRQKKRRNIEFVWLESIEILESRNRSEFRSSSDGYKEVFDLEIEDNHNFFANNILVSNCQRLKNVSSNTYKNFKKLFKSDLFKNKKISKIFLSGTPAPNRAHELYSVLNQISPMDFPNKAHFYSYYCGMEYETGMYGGWKPNEAQSKFEELFHRIAPHVYRKKKDEVLKDLPDKTYQRIIVEMSKKDEDTYYEIEEGVANEIFEAEKMGSGHILTIMLRLRQYTSILKIKNVKEIVTTLIEAGEKVVIVDVFKDNLKTLHKEFPNISALHTGDMTVDERNDIVQDFQNPDGKTKIFLGTIQTCNYGLTLTEASKLFILTLPYSVGEYDQVSDRLHRIGQKDNVNIYLKPDHIHPLNKVRSI
jgi:hypothetical protein